MSKKKLSIYLTTSERLIAFLKKVNRVAFGKTTAQKFFRYYILLILIGAILLYIGPSLLSGYREDGGVNGRSSKWSFIDALFTSSSAFSDTGLSVSSPRDTFSFFGQFVILILIQIGGIGYMTVKLLLWRLFLSKNTSLSERIMLQAERGHSKLGTSSNMILVSATTVIVIEIICGLIMMFWFYYHPAYVQVIDPNPIYSSSCSIPAGTGAPVFTTSCTALTVDDKSNYVEAYQNWNKAAWWGFFHSISAMNNAGFDIMGASSIGAYRNDENAFIQVIMLFELVIGGLGFPLIYDVMQWLKTRKNGERFRFSVFTKLSIITYVIVWLVGMSLSLGSEVASTTYYSAEDSKFLILNYDNSTGAFGRNETANKYWTVIFTSFSTRNAGFSTVDPHIFTNSNKWIQAIMMFIGSSPSSTAGGIRTTTLAIVVIVLFRKMAGRKNITIFKKNISKEIVNSAFISIFLSMFLVLFGVIIVQISPFANRSAVNFQFIDAFYETSSAFGTTGLSTGLTSHLEWWALMYLALLMFIGQLGVSSAILSWAKKDSKKNNHKFTNEDLIIG